MSDVGQVRVRVPSTIRPGQLVRARALVIHPMERIERDQGGRIVERNYNYINRVVASYLGHPVAIFETTQSVSENPIVTFSFRATDPGLLTVTFTDTRGGTYEGSARITFA